jgi:hypothetical protein
MIVKPHDEAGRKAGCRLGRLQGSTELVPEPGIGGLSPAKDPAHSELRRPPVCP